MKDIKDRRYSVRERLDVADIDARLCRLRNSTAAQLVINRVAKLADVTVGQISSCLPLN